MSGREERSADHAGGRRSKGSGHIRLLVMPGGHKLRLKPWSSAVDVKQRLREVTGVPVAWMRLFDGPRELPSGARMIDLLPSGDRLGSCSSSRRRVVSLTLTAQNPSDFATGCYMQAWGAQATELDPDAAQLLSRCQHVRP
jgi:hypothetical protein